MTNIYRPERKAIITTIYTLATGLVGALIAYLLSLPVYVLTGPAIMVSLASISGIRFEVNILVRDAAFLVLGVGIGAGFNEQATAAFLRWPVAFAGLAMMLVAILASGRFMLVHFFNFDKRSAVLASSPGHLSFVIGLGSTLDLDVARVAVAQSVRLLALTLLVPFAAMGFGIEIPPDLLPRGELMQPAHLVILLAVSLAFGLLLGRVKVPVALFIAGMSMSAFTHAFNLTPGTVSSWLTIPGMIVLGSLIGSRFSGVTLKQIKRALLAGLMNTAIAALLAALFAWPVSVFMEIPLLHVAVAFSPGGLEMMVVMGAILGANPGFVAACHIGRLLFLPLILPFFLGRDKGA